MTLTESSSPFSQANTFHKACLAWIVGVRNRHSVALSLTGLPSLQNRMYALAVGLYNHLLYMQDSNPAKFMLDWYQHQIPWPEQILLPRAALRHILSPLPHLLPRPPATVVPVHERMREYQMCELHCPGGLA